MDLEIFGRRLRIQKEKEGWTVMIIGKDGKTRISEDILIPSTLREHEIRQYLEDLLHEYAPYGKTRDKGNP